MHQAAYQQPVFSMQQDYSLYSGGMTFEGVTGSDFGLGSAPMPIKGMPAGKSRQQQPFLVSGDMECCDVSCSVPLGSSSRGSV